jgi:signal transduction histidine kinase
VGPAFPRYSGAVEHDTLGQLVAAYEVGDLVTRRLLVVDDEPLNCDVVAGLLEDDYTVLQATTAEEALRIVAETPLDVIITDQRMPGHSGVDLLERVRSTHPDIVGIVLTAYTDTPAIMAAINRAGAFRFITKPWQAEHLQLAVAEATETVYQRRAIRRLVELLARRNSELAAAMEDLQSTQGQMLHLERLSTIGRLTAGVSHELRNLLTALTLLKTDAQITTEPQELVETVEVVQACVNNMMATLQTMNQFARAGRVEVRAAQVAPADIVHDAVTVMRMDMGFRRRRTEVRLEPNLPPVTGDRQLLTQVLVNLLRNAVQATTEGSLVVLEATRDGDGRVVLAVEDDGPGVPRAVRDHLFEPFTSTKGAEGMGMGLYMARLIVESHRGTIRLVDRKGGGTRFEVRP